MTRIITTPKRLLVEVPEGAYDMRIEGNQLVGYKRTGSIYWFRDLPPASYGEPVLASEMTEEQWEKVVEYFSDYEIMRSGYKNYARWAQEYDLFETASISGLSLLRAHSLKPETTVVIDKN